MKITSRTLHWQPFIVILALDGLIFGLTDANQVPSFLLILGLGLLILTLYLLARGFMKLLRLYGLSVKQPRRLALYLCGITAGLVALQSVGELGARDILVAVPLALLAYLYNSYAKTGADMGG